MTMSLLAAPPFVHVSGSRNGLVRLLRARRQPGLRNCERAYPEWLLPHLSQNLHIGPRRVAANFSIFVPGQMIA